MPTHVSGSYADVYDWTNLMFAYRKAAKGKRSRGPAAAFEYRLEDNLIKLQMDLAAQDYRPGGYTNFTIHEPKRRLISAAPFRDRVVHHATLRSSHPQMRTGRQNPHLRMLTPHCDRAVAVP